MLGHPEDPVQTQLRDSIRGMEFDNVVYVYPICLRCGREFYESMAMTRAKATLNMSRYALENKLCSCSHGGIEVGNPDSVADRNDKLLEWKLKPSVTEEDISDDVKNTLQKAANLRKLLEF